MNEYIYIYVGVGESAYSYLHLPSMVSDDEPEEDDGRQADKTFQCQGIHGAL